MTSEAPSTELTTELSTSEGPASQTVTEGSTTDYSDAETVSLEFSTLAWSSSDSTTEESTIWPTTEITRYYDWLEHKDDDKFDKFSNGNDWIDEHDEGQ
ncbi:unnamed protein product, partial [Mesorhabditis spiculigera]